MTFFDKGHRGDKEYIHSILLTSDTLTSLYTANHKKGVCQLQPILKCNIHIIYLFYDKILS